MRIYNSKGYQVSKWEIEKVLSDPKYDLSGYSPELIQDIAARYSGEKPRTWSEVESDMPISEFCRDSDGDYRLHDSGSAYTKNYVSKKEDYLKTSKKYYQNLLQFISQLPDKVPGATPLTKACNVVQALSNEGTQLEDSDGDAGTPVPLFSQSSSEVQKELEKLKNKIEILDKLEPEDIRSITNSTDKETAFLNMDEKIQIILKVEQFLRKSGKLTPNPQGKYVPDIQGEYTLMRQSRTIGDLSQVKKSALMKRDKLGYSLLAGKVQVPVKYKKENPIPMLNVLLDDSGSMNSSNKDIKALGVIYYIVKEVAKGNCAALIAKFEQKVYDPVFLKVGEDYTDWFWNEFKPEFDGGGTEIGECIKEFLGIIGETIQTENLDVDTSQTHLVLINDGQDDASEITPSMIHPNIIHGFILDSTNKDIENLCKATGGMYVKEL